MMKMAMKILKYLGWFFALILLIFQLTEANVACLSKDSEIFDLKGKLDARGFVKMEDFHDFQTAYKVILQDYPEMIRAGWEMAMPDVEESYIVVYFPNRFSAVVTITFEPDGNYSVKAVR